MASSDEAAWYDELFDERYLAFYEELLDLSIAERDVEFLDRALALAPRSRILDLGCGFGRHAVALGRRGHDVTGVDRSAAMLSLARASADEAALQVRWEQRDMRELGGLGPFDVCVCLYTVLGYFDDAGNAATVAAARSVLGAGGRLVLDVTNPLPLLARWPHEHWCETSGGVRRETSHYDAMTGRLRTERVLLCGGGQHVALPTSDVRMYAPYELRALLHAAGFEVEQVFGGLRDELFQWNRSPRQVFVARAR